MLSVYIALVKLGRRTLGQVPEKYRAEVAAALGLEV